MRRFAVDVKRLVEGAKDFGRPMPERCPRCEGHLLWDRGYVETHKASFFADTYGCRNK